MANIASLIVEVKNKGIEATKRALKGLSSESKKTEKATAGLTKAFAALGGVIGITSAARSVIGATVRQEQALAQLNQRLKSTQGAAGLTSNELQNMAKAMQSVTTFGDEVVMEAQSLLLTFTKVGKEVFPEATETILDMSVAMNQGLKESAIQLGKALNDPIQGVTALRRVGVQLTETQEQQIKKFVELNDIASAQKVILGELSTQMGGAARAARNTLGGALDGLKNSFGDLLEGEGGSVTAATDAINDLTEKLSDPKTKESFQVLVDLFFNVASTSVDVITFMTDFNAKVDDLLGKDFSKLGPLAWVINGYEWLTGEDNKRQDKRGTMGRGNLGKNLIAQGDDAGKVNVPRISPSVSFDFIADEKTQDDFTKTTDLIFQYTSGLEKLRMEYDRNAAEIKKSVGTDKEKSEALKLLDDRFNKQREELYLQSDAYLQLKDDAVSFFEAQEEAAEQAEEKMRQYGENVKGVFQGIFQTMNSGGSIGDFLKNRLMGNIADMASDKASSLFTSKVDSGSLLGKIGGLFFDNGGHIPSGSAGIVGEFGPEIVRGPANVTSRKDTAKQMGNTFNISLPGVTNKKDAFEARGQIERTIAMAVNKAGRYA